MGIRLAKGIVVAGTASSTGKTTVTLGLMAALKARGFRVQSFKAGPDYIDPGHHSALLGCPSYNLDTWMCGASGVKKTYRRVSADADISVIEGVMGLFDGKFVGANSGVKEFTPSVEGSTAHLAKVLKKPVLLVIDASRAATSAGAVVKGFCDFDPDLKVKYVIFNKVGSDRHVEILKASVKGIKGVTLLGCVRRDDKLKMPARHLGLVTNADLERKRWKSFVKAARLAVEEGVDITLLLRSLKVNKQALKQSKAVGAEAVNERSKRVLRAVVKIAVASDPAFCFYYAENLDLLVKAGAHLVYFSPIKSKKLPRGISGIYLGGGYPELHAKELESNRALKAEVKAAAQSGMPVLAECGGLIYLCASLKEASGGLTSSMVNLLPFDVEMGLKRSALGYTEVTTTGTFPYLPEGQVLRGHEYHYSCIKGSSRGVERAFTVEEERVKDGVRSFKGFIYKNVVASYIHLHFGSNKAFAPGFVETCVRYKENK